MPERITSISSIAPHQRSRLRLALTCVGVVLLCRTVAAQVVDPASILSDPSPTCGGGSESYEVCITLPPETIVDKVDVFLLFDDTGSFAGQVPGLVSVFNNIVDELQLSLPDVDLAFGIGRFEDYGGPGFDYGGEVQQGRPFILNQAIIRTANPSFDADIAAALSNTAPGFGGDGPESAISEGLAQVALGVGFDGNGNGNTTDSGPAGDINTQINPGTSGDVPAFDSYVGSGDGSLGGVGWRTDALRLVLLATDVCPISAFDFDTGIPVEIVGTGSIEPVTAFACSSTVPGSARFGYVGDAKSFAANTIPGAVAPLEAGTVPDTVAALNALGIRVIGLGPGAGPTDFPGPSGDESVFLSALARLTGAVDGVGDPLVFNIAGGSGPIADAIVEAVQTTTTEPIDIILTADPDLPGLTVDVAPPVHEDVGPGEMVCFDVTFTGDETFEGGVFDLNFRDLASNAIIGTIPVELICPAFIGVHLDIKPGSCPNPVNGTSNGYIPIALIGSTDFDVEDIDLGSLSLFRADGIGGSVTPWAGPPGPHTSISDVGTAFEGELCDCTTDGPDGFDDLLMHFSTPEVVAGLELFSLPGGSELELCVSGTLLDGTPFEACDCILIVPPHGNAAVSANAGVSLALSPTDLFGNGGGVGVLTRWYQPNTEVTATAPAVVVNAHERFRYWVVDGAAQPTGQTTITVTVGSWNQQTVLRAVYGAPSTHVVGQGSDAE